MRRSVPLRIASAGAVLALAAACASGSSSNGSGGGSNGGSSSGKTIHLGMSVANISLNFATEMIDGAKQAVAHSDNVELKVVGPPNTDGPAEERLFETLTETATDGIVLENLDPPIFTRPAANAVDQGIKVVALDTAPTHGSKVDFYVGNDNYELGATLAKQALKRMPDNPKGTVVVGEPNPGAPVLDSRAEGIKDTFKKEAPHVKVIGPFQTYSDPAQNYGAWLSQVHAHPDALAFLGVGDADSYDLAKIKKKERGDYLVAGTDVDAKTLEDVKAGLDFCTIDPEHFLKGYIAMKLLIESNRGTPLPSGWFKTPGLVVDTSNVDEIIKREKSQKNEYDFYKPQIKKLLSNVKGHMKPLSEAR
ncbi:MAG: sugar ABC transporter substrate-binding protein [Streptosporangiaceae bacterium]